MNSTVRLSIVSLIAVILSACATSVSKPVADNFIAQTYVRPAKGSRVIILPPTAKYRDFQPGLDLVEDELEKQVLAAGYEPQLVVRSDFDLVWREEVDAVGGVYDATTGALRAAKYEQATAAMVRRIATELKGQLLLVPQLVLRTAKLDGGNVEWDGRTFTVPITKSDRRVTKFSGNIPGLSLQISAFDVGGGLQFGSHGALLFPYRHNMEEVVNEVRPDMFSHRDEIVEGVAIALMPLTK